MMKNSTVLFWTIGSVAAAVLAIYAVRQSSQAAKRLHELELKVSELRASTNAWVMCADRKVQARLTAEHDQTDPGVPVVVFFELRNVTSELLTVCRPNLASWDLLLERDGARARYVGGVPDVAPPMPMELAVGDTERVSITVKPDVFPDMHLTGAFVLTVMYRSQGLQGDFWQGDVGRLNAKWTSR